MTASIDDDLALSWFTRPRPLPPIPAAAPWLARARRSSLLCDGRPIIVWEWGDGPPVLLVHGWEGAAAQFHALLPALLAEGYRAVAPDLPGHGATGGDRSHFMAIADGLLAVGERLRAEAGPIAGLVGHSMGSAAAIHAFANGLRVGRSVHVAGPTSLARMVRRLCRAAGLEERQAGRVADRLAVTIGRPLEAVDLEQLRHGLDHPGLLLHDPEDNLVPFAESRRLLAAWPGARLLELPGSGHLGILSDHRLGAAIRDFLPLRADAA